jgi:PAS domain S-box-containing protein
LIDSFYPVLEALGEAALLTDAELNLVMLNSAAEALYEVKHHNMLGRKLVDLIGSSVSAAQDEGWATVLGGDVWRGVVWHQKPNRQRFRAEVSVRALFDNSNALEGIIAIVKDVTEREAELIRQSILSRSLQAIGDAPTNQDLYQVMLETLTQGDGADGAVFRVRENNGYKIVAVSGVEKTALEPIWISDFTQEEPAFLRGQTIKIVFAEPNIHPKYKLIESLGFREAHLVGQRVAGELIGSIALVYRQTPWVDLRPILPEIASALGARLERERTHMRLERERAALEVLAQVSTVMRQAQTHQELYEISTEFALKATRASSASVLLANPERTEMRPASCSGMLASETIHLTLTRERGLSWQVLDTGQPRVEEHAAQLPEAYTMRTLQQGAYVGVPIRQSTDTNTQVIGVLCADTLGDRDRLLPVDLDILTAIAEALSSALVRVEALQTAQQRAEAFAKLAQLSSDLEQLDDEQAIATLGMQTLLDLTGLEAAVYFALESDKVIPLAVLGNVPEGYLLYRQTMPVTAQGIFNSVINSGQIVLLNDYQNQSDAKPELQKFGFRTGLLAPVHLNGQVKAFLSAASFSKAMPLLANTREIAEFIAKRLTRAMERAESIQEVLNTRAQTFRTLGLALEMRDFETKGHTDRVLDLAMRLGKTLKLEEPQLQALEWGALLHDIGKVAVPDHVLLKPDKLSPDEWLWIRQHPSIGYQMLQGLEFLPQATLDIVLYHQERTDGTGYPEGLQLENIPYLARLFAVVDVFDALTSERPYKRAWTTEAAMTELQHQAGSTLDAALVKTFLETLKTPVIA